ncbi:MAG: hypothetical protein SOZ75_03005 [Candidatus Enterosoma sp.]|nr:hypothetical protein [Candidatus Enterosoma sp.]MDY4730678.1 hypothetical protein [Lactobacillus amylovorus]
MSVVIAIKENGVTYMAADTQISFGDSKRHLKSDSLQKVWAVTDTPHCIMGGVGLTRDLNLIRYCTSELIPEASVLKNEINVGTIMLNTVPTIFESIRNYTQLVTGCDKDIPINSEFVLAYKDKIFDIAPDGTVEKVEDYIAIGSGADAALGSLKHTTDEPVYDRLIKALDAASESNLYVSEPYVCMDTEHCMLMDLLFDDMLEEDEEDEAESQEESANTKEN